MTATMNDAVVEARRLVLARADAWRRLVCAVDAATDPDPLLTDRILAGRVVEAHRHYVDAERRATDAVVRVAQLEVDPEVTAEINAVVEACRAGAADPATCDAFAVTDPVLGAVVALPWAEVWPDGWQQLDDVVTAGHRAEVWQAVVDDQLITATCWADACQVDAGQAAGEIAVKSDGRPSASARPSGTYPATLGDLGIDRRRLAPGRHGKVAVYAWRHGTTVADLVRGLRRAVDGAAA